MTGARRTTRPPVALAVLALHGAVVWALATQALRPAAAGPTAAPGAAPVLAWATLLRDPAAPAVRPMATAQAMPRAADAPPAPGPRGAAATAGVPRPAPAAPAPATGPAAPSEGAPAAAAAEEALAPGLPAAGVSPPSAHPPAAAAHTGPSPGLAEPRAPTLIQARADRHDCPQVPHPAVLRERGIEGVVHLRVRVSARGEAAEIQLSRTSGWRLFDAAALAQARACRFLPARHGTEPVESWVEFPVRFALDG